MRLSFAEWFYTETTGLSKNDFTSLSLKDRMAQGRDIGEPFIKRQLAMHGLVITGVPARMDKTQKIDGMLNGEPVQIKLRRSGMAGRNDISYEVCRNHDDSRPLSEQLKDFHQQGRDYKGQVKHYFVMNQTETEIYHVPAALIKASVDRAITELDTKGGHLTRPLKASDGTELRPTQDKDAESFTPFKVMAFIPVSNVILKAYPIQPDTASSMAAGKNIGGGAVSVNPMAHQVLKKSDVETAADEVEQKGSGIIRLQSSNPKNLIKKMKEIRSFAAQRRLRVTDNGDGTVTLTK